jgi:hypothetical protein
VVIDELGGHGSQRVDGPTHLEVLALELVDHAGVVGASGRRPSRPADVDRELVDDAW